MGHPFYRDRCPPMVFGPVHDSETGHELKPAVIGLVIYKLAHAYAHRGLSPAEVTEMLNRWTLSVPAERSRAVC